MSRESSLVKNTAILAIGTLGPKIIAVISLPILTAYLTKLEYGSYDLIITLVSLLLPVATLQIQSAAFRFLIECRGDKDESSRIVSNIFIVTIPITIIVVVLVFIFFPSLNFINRCLVATYYFIDIIYLAFQQITRGLSHNLQYSKAAVILSFINMLLIVFLVAGVKLGLTGVLIASNISCLISSIYLFNVIKSDVSFNVVKYYSPSTIKEMLNYSWPMVPNNLSNWVLGLSDRVVITAALGIEANAVYAVAQKIPNLFVILQSTFTLAWQENASIASADEDSISYYSKIYDTLITFLSTGLCCLIAVTPLIFRLLIRGNYDEAYRQMPILYLGMLFNCLGAFLGGIYVAKKEIKSVGLTTALAAICNLIIDILLVKRIGIYAGSISTLISYFLLTTFRMLDLHKKYGIRYKYKKILGLLLIAILVASLSYTRRLLSDIINAIIAFPLFFFANKSLLLSSILAIKKFIKQEND